MKNKRIIAAALAAALIIIFAGVGFKLYSDAGEYYTQIDNSKIEQLESKGGVIDFTGGMSYQYTLTAYDENGKEKTIKFGTEKELKEDAFICLTVKPIQGVVDWKEVLYEELPQAAQSNYTPQ